MDIMPMFPLGMVVFLGEYVNLHIFEHRYRQLINECHASGIHFGIPYVENQKLHNFAAEMKLLRIAHKYPDGKMDVHLEAVGLVEIHDFYPKFNNKLYPAATYTPLIIDQRPDINLNLHITLMLQELYELLSIDNVEVKDPSEFRTWQVIHKIGLSQEQELLLQAMPSEIEKVAYIYDHLKNFVPKVRLTYELKQKAAHNGHFKE